MADVKTAPGRPAATQGNTAGKPKNSNNFFVNLIVVLACILVGYLTWKFVMGNTNNFQDADRKHAKEGNFLGLMYQGGFVVPVLLATLFTLLSFIVERSLTIFKAKGKMDSGEFVRKVQYHLSLIHISEPTRPY